MHFLLLCSYMATLNNCIIGEQQTSASQETKQPNKNKKGKCSLLQVQLEDHLPVKERSCFVQQPVHVEVVPCKIE